MKLTPGTVAVVTGAASGIGRALAVTLGGRGCALALADVNAAGLRETATLASQTGTPRVTTALVNVAEQSAVSRFASDVEEQHGGAHLLINNAGVALGGTFAEVALEDFAWLMGINFWGVVYGVKAFLPQLRRQQAAHIVNISSVFGLAAPPGQTAYASSKFAVRGFTESLRAELQGTAVAVSCVHPGGVKTNIASNARTTVTDPVRLAAEQKRWEQLLRIPPQEAATVIVRGIERNRARILIGNDARLLDALARLSPTVVGRLLADRATH
jgi:NAD(P)-dependent dehydrogenase (short-subunit alcohol dehydrogenase family)